MHVEEWLGIDQAEDKTSSIGLSIYNKKYRKFGESFEHFARRVADGDEDVYQLIIKKRFLPGGRIMSNIGIDDDKSSMMNCYSRGFIADDYHDIMQAAVDIGETFKAQGGQGLSLTKLRPKGTPIGDKYESDGIIPFMKIYNEVTEGTSQGGARKGALLISLDAWHKEAMNFITIKSKDGLIEKANLSLEIDDEFMEAVKKYYDTGEVVTVTRKENYSGHEVEWDVTPIEVFKAMIHNNWDWGDPGCLFVNKFRNYNLMEYVDRYQIETCNPSLRKGTLILTKDGIAPIETLEGKKFKVLTINNEYADAECFLSGRDKPLYKITLENGREIFCTAEHKWPILQENGKYSKLETSDIRPGLWLPVSRSQELPMGADGNYDDGFFFGFWYGDGSVTKRKDDHRNQYGFTFGNEKLGNIKDIIISHISKVTEKAISAHTRQRDGKEWQECCCGDAKLDYYFKKFGVHNKDHFPDGLLSTLSEEFRKGFIDGLFSSDGGVNTNKKNSLLILTTSKVTIANEFSDLLWWYGLRNNISKIERTSSIFGREEQTYVAYRVSLGMQSLEDFSRMITLTNEEKQNKILTAHKTRRETKLHDNIKIVNVELTDLHEDVWDIHVYDDSHTFRINYCVTGNCGEQPLPKNFACNLGSLNLSEFVLDPYTYNAKFDYDALCAAVAPCVRYLDHVVDINAPRHPLVEQRENSLNYRNIGLGVFGYASALMKLGMRYGSEEALKFTDDLFNILFRTAVLESSNLAAQLGSFPKYSEKVWDSTIIQRHFSDHEIEYMKKQGLRNCSLLSIAPTGSLSTMLGETGGCEPEFAISYQRRTVGLTNNQDEYYDVYCKSAKEYMEINKTAILPGWFVSSAEIDPHDRVATQAVMQLHVDTAISSTVNLPESCSEDEMAAIYIDAWESGLKGITIFRNGCKRLGILTTGSDKQETVSVESKDLQRGDIISASDALISFKKTITSGCGKFYLHSDFDEATGEQLETFIDIGSGGGCERNLQFISRLISLCLRGGIPVEAIIDQGKSIRPCNAYVTRTHKKGDTSRGTSCPSAIAFALEEVNERVHDWIVDDDVETIVDQVVMREDKEPESGSKCPECGATLTFEGGCNVCKGDATHPGCGWSKCG